MTYPTRPDSELNTLQELEEIRKKYLELREAFINLAKHNHMIDHTHSSFIFEGCGEEICRIHRLILERTKL